jgi:hypothetical protein
MEHTRSFLKLVSSMLHISPPNAEWGKKTSEGIAVEVDSTIQH